MSREPTVPRRGTDLGSWADGPARAAIVAFVERVTDRRSADHVDPADRIAVLDNDGTLWCEKPMPVQLDFVVRRMARIAREDPSLAERQPYRAAVEGDPEWLEQALRKHDRGDDADLHVLAAAITSAFARVGVEEYRRRVTRFFEEAAHPRLRRPYIECAYAPMVELVHYLAVHGFTCYLATGGDRDFVRAVAGRLYGIPPEQVIGSAVGLAFRDGPVADLLYTSEMDVFDDGAQKPVRIWSRIGRRPILAVGNADGDAPMLSWTGGPDRPALRLVVRHDDDEREYAYSAGAERLLRRAHADDWTVVSMRDDWTTVFARRGAPLSR